MHRLLEKDEPINEGDEAYVQTDYEGDREWQDVTESSIGKKCSDYGYGEPIRRDMDKWQDGMPPPGTLVGIEHEIVKNEKCVVITNMDDRVAWYCKHEHALTIHKEFLKPWSEE